ncbi:MAG: M48 family metallopeptidase [Burkholderiaceae bacterium]|nr:M48 family metallopeptidase [Burkholderiaceae bacterium]
MIELDDPGCAALYFDGVRARARRVRLHVADNVLEVRGEGVQRALPLADVQWPESTRHGALILRFADGASAEVEDRAGLARLATAAGVREGLIVRAQNRLSLALGALVALVAIVALLITQGVPLASGWLARHTPPALEARLRDAVLALVDSRYMEPSRLSAARQQQIRDVLLERFAQAGEGGEAPEILFRGSRIGPNALALPGKSIVLTDELIELAPDFDGVFGVCAHEYGHVRLKHGLRGLYEALSLTMLAGVLFGDYGNVVAAAPVMLTTLGYSRAREREADLEALRLMRAAGRPPEAMARMFEALAGAKAGRAAPPIAFSSHPPDAERIALFRSAR